MKLKPLWFHLRWVTKLITINTYLYKILDVPPLTMLSFNTFERMKRLSTDLLKFGYLA